MCTSMVDDQMCQNMDCDQLSIAIDQQTTRLDTCGACKRVQLNAQTTLDNCNAIFNRECQAETQEEEVAV